MNNLDTLSTNDLFRSALEDASKASVLSSLDDESRALVQSALSKLKILSSRISNLALFSTNEKFEELATRHIPYMLVPYIAADLELSSRVMGVDRTVRIEAAIGHIRVFLTLLNDYEVIPEEECALYDQKTLNPTDTRAAKIAQFKKEKELRSKVEALQQRRGLVITPSGSKDYGLILGLFPRKDTEEENEEELRTLLTSVLRLLWTEAQKLLSNAVREMEILRSAPPPQASAGEGSNGYYLSAPDRSWKLDAPQPKGGPDGKGPLLDKQGKPLRLFTILPTSATDRARIQGQVFQSDHRLPTMTIDQFLEEELRRGNVITGGGKASENQPTSKVLLQEASEMDGTLEGEKKSEQKRREEEEWARFTEANPKGWGNTMNRG